MAILRGTDCFILKWTCHAFLAVRRQRSFSKLLKLQNETRTNENVVLFCCHVVLETVYVELHGRSHPAHNAARQVSIYRTHLIGLNTTWLCHYSTSDWTTSVWTDDVFLYLPENGISHNSLSIFFSSLNELSMWPPSPRSLYGFTARVFDVPWASCMWNAWGSFPQGRND